MVEYITDLHDHMFPHFSRSDISTLLSLMERVVLETGDVLVSFDQPGAKFFIVAEGRLAVQKRTGFGERTQVVALLDPGAPVGERALLRDNIHCSTLVAVKKTELFSLSRKNFEKLKKEHFLLAMSLLEWLLDITSLRLRKNSDRLSHVL